MGIAVLLLLLVLITVNNGDDYDNDIRKNKNNNKNDWNDNNENKNTSLSTTHNEDDNDSEDNVYFRRRNGPLEQRPQRRLAQWQSPGRECRRQRRGGHHCVALAPLPPTPPAHARARPHAARHPTHVPWGATPIHPGGRPSRALAARPDAEARFVRGGAAGKAWACADCLPWNRSFFSCALCQSVSLSLHFILSLSLFIILSFFSSALCQSVSFFLFLTIAQIFGVRLTKSRCTKHKNDKSLLQELH